MASCVFGDRLGPSDHTGKGDVGRSPAVNNLLTGLTSLCAVLAEWTCGEHVLGRGRAQQAVEHRKGGRDGWSEGRRGDVCRMLLSKAAGEAVSPSTASPSPSLYCSPSPSPSPSLSPLRPPAPLLSASMLSPTEAAVHLRVQIGCDSSTISSGGLS